MYLINAYEKHRKCSNLFYTSFWLIIEDCLIVQTCFFLLNGKVLMTTHAMFGWMIINQNYHSFHMFVSVFHVAIFISFVFSLLRSIGNILKFSQNVNIVETNINLFYYCLHCSDRYSHFFLPLSLFLFGYLLPIVIAFLRLCLFICTQKKSWSRLDVRSLATLAHITNQYVWYSFHTFRHQFLYIFFLLWLNKKWG